MAVANFHYITRMSSGFKVYILEGQPNLRSEDRYRHMTNERVRVPPAHPIKRKHSAERGLTLEERRERILSRASARGAQRPPTAVQFSVPQSPPTSTSSPWSPAPSPPTGPPPGHAYATPAMDEPLDLIKKPRKERERTEEKSKTPTVSQIQMRPSVITCVPSVRNPSCQSEQRSGHSSTVISKSTSCDHVVDEHFQRSLGLDYQPRAAAHRQLSISVSVDDHFAKALGEKWTQIKSQSSSSSSCSSSSSSASSPSPSSPGVVTHSGHSRHSPSHTPKGSPSSTTTPTRGFWSAK